MIAASFAETGPSSVIRVGEVQTPDPGPGEVRVRVAVSGVNPTDWKARSGATDRAMTPFRIPNQDGAGTIDAVGEGVDPARIGERVWVYFASQGRRWGTAAQFTLVPAERAVPLPDEASFDLGACLGIPAMTAYLCLVSDGPVEGRTVLVAGGAGAVGHYAIELARWMGARVIATASSDEKAAMAEAAGAHAVVRYRDPDATEQLAAAAPDGIDRVIELALAANLELDLSALNPHASIVTYADDGGPPPQVAVRPLMLPNIVLRFFLIYTMPADAVRAAARAVGAAAAAGALTELPLHRFTLEQTAAAHDAVQAGAVGKVVIDVA